MFQISNEGRDKARRAFWWVTAICLGLSFISMAGVSGGGFHYKAQQTAAIGTVSLLVPAWVLIGGLCAVPAFFMPARTEAPAAPASPWGALQPSAAPAPEPIATRSWTRALTVYAYATLVALLAAIATFLVLAVVFRSIPGIVLMLIPAGVGWLLASLFLKIAR